MNKNQLLAYQIGIIGQFHHPELPPIILIGRSGIGKTAVTKAIAKAMRKKLFGFEMSGKCAEDISGYGVPDHTTGTMRFYPDAYVRAILDLPEGSCIVFFDEICDLVPSVQRAVHPVLCGKTFGIEQLPLLTALCGAGNPPEISTTGGAMAIPVRKRVCCIDADTDANAWADGHESGFKNMDVVEFDSSWTAHIPQERSMVSAFIRNAPEYLDKDAAESHLAAPCPRQWTHVALYNALCKGTKHMEARMILLAGCIGEELALKYVNWEKKQDIPDWRDVLSGEVNQHSPNWPKRGDQILTMAKACVAGTLSDGEFTCQNVQACWDLIGTLYETGHADYASLACIDLAKAGSPKGWNGTLPDVEELFEILKDAGLID